MCGSLIIEIIISVRLSQAQRVAQTLTFRIESFKAYESYGMGDMWPFEKVSALVRTFGTLKLGLINSDLFFCLESMFWLKVTLGYH